MSANGLRLDQTLGGKYRIVKFLAEGGMGSVYEAQHLVVKRRFAVKFLRSDLMRRRDVLARFRLEAEAAGAIESENIAAALDFGIAADGAPYIVMEYLDGIDLGRLLSVHGTLPPERAADLVHQACAGAQRAHEAGVLHRDLKPRNLFVCRRSDGTDLVKIVDFGVAKLQAGEAINAVTRTGGLVGTPSYMSPEQAKGEPHIDARTDVYALGVILYELLTGRTPHPGDSYNAVLHHIATQPALGLESAQHELPAALIAIVQRAIASDVQARQSSAAELGRELARFARRDVWSPVIPEASSEPSSEPSPEGPSEDLVEASPEERTASVHGSPRIRVDDAPPLPEHSHPSAERRRPRPIWLLLSIALGTLALFGALWSSPRSAVPRTEPRRVAPPPHLQQALATEAAKDVEPALPERFESSAAPAAAPASDVSTNVHVDASNAAPAHSPKPRVPTRPPVARATARQAGGARFDPQNPYD